MNKKIDVMLGMILLISTLVYAQIMTSFSYRNVATLDVWQFSGILALTVVGCCFGGYYSGWFMGVLKPSYNHSKMHKEKKI